MAKGMGSLFTKLNEINYDVNVPADVLNGDFANLGLEADGMPLKRIARLTGFRDEQALRRAFLQQMSVTPTEYRERFGIAEPTDGPA